MLFAHAILKLLSTPQSCLTLCSPMDCSLPLSMGFSRQEYWSGFPCLPSGDLPNPGIEPASLMSPALSDGFFTPSATCPDGSYQLMALQHQPSLLGAPPFPVSLSLLNLPGLAC